MQLDFFAHPSVLMAVFTPFRTVMVNKLMTFFPNYDMI